MRFKTLITFAFLAIVMDCHATVVPCPTEMEVDKIVPDVSKILPPIDVFAEAMKRVTERYKNVYEPISEQETQQRISNAKQDALIFYLNIFAVELSEIERYSDEFKIEQYLCWVAKEIINNGEYVFAENEDKLFDSCTDSIGGYNMTSVSSATTIEFPDRKQIPELFKIYVVYNNPYFEEFLVHETGHVIDYAYRVYNNIRSETMDYKNNSTCHEAVSVFFETIYVNKKDPTFMWQRLIDLYRISFTQSYIEKIIELGKRDKENEHKKYEAIEKITDVKKYDPSECFGRISPEKFMEDTKDKHPELSFIYDLWNAQIKEWKISPMLPLSHIAMGVADNIGDILQIYKAQEMKLETCMCMYNEIIHRYVHYVPHMYRTLKRIDGLKTSQQIVARLDEIVKNVPGSMTEVELKDLLQLQGFH